nr:xylulose kinase-1 [Tanacetum cinerariifolium]
MALTFTDTHNMIAFLTKSDASKGFNQIIDFLNASSIKYALTVNPNIYASIIKQFWSSVAVRKVNGVSRIQAVVDRKKVIITEATIRDALCLDDAEGLKRRNKLKAFKLRRLKKVDTTQKVKTSDDTVMDDVSKQGRIIAYMDADKDVTLKDVAAIAKDV